MDSYEPTRTIAYSNDLRWRMVYQRKVLKYNYAEISRNLGVEKSTWWEWIDWLNVILPHPFPLWHFLLQDWCKRQYSKISRNCDYDALCGFAVNINPFINTFEVRIGGVFVKNTFFNQSLKYLAFSQHIYMYLLLYKCIYTQYLLQKLLLCLLTM